MGSPAAVHPFPDDWGTFRFIVIKICNLAGQKCILLQGHNHCTDAGLVESANRKVGLHLMCVLLLLAGFPLTGGLLSTRR